MKGGKGMEEKKFEALRVPEGHWEQECERLRRELAERDSTIEALEYAIRMCMLNAKGGEGR